MLSSSFCFTWSFYIVPMQLFLVSVPYLHFFFYGFLTWLFFGQVKKKCMCLIYSALVVSLSGITFFLAYYLSKQTAHKEKSKRYFYLTAVFCLSFQAFIVVSHSVPGALWPILALAPLNSINQPINHLKCIQVCHPMLVSIPHILCQLCL